LVLGLSDSKIQGRLRPWISVCQIRKSKAGGCLGFKFIRFENRRQVAALDFSLSDSKIDGRWLPWISVYQIRKSKAGGCLGFQFIRFGNQRQLADLDLKCVNVYEDITISWATTPAGGPPRQPAVYKFTLFFQYMTSQRRHGSLYLLSKNNISRFR
jgi:hypothetical protein